MADEGNELHCARHRGIVTVLRCGRCETPICPRCQVGSAVGFRCPACAGVGLAGIRLRPAVLSRAAGASVALGVFGGALYILVPMLQGLFLSLLAGALLGLGTARLVLRATGDRGGIPEAWTTVAGFALGFLLGRLLTLLLLNDPTSLDRVARLATFALLMRPLETALLLVAAALVAYNRVR